MKKQMVVVEAWVPGPVDPDAHPEHPIYIPIVPPEEVYPPGIWGGGNENFPTPPIFIPCPPPGIWGPDDPRPTPPIHLPDERPPGSWGGAGEGFPTPPIYIPVPVPPDLGFWGPGDNRPNPPIYIPVEPPTPENPIVLPPWVDLDDEQKEKLVDFLTGNLPPYEGPPTTQPV